MNYEIMLFCFISFIHLEYTLIFSLYFRSSINIGQDLFDILKTSLFINYD